MEFRIADTFQQSLARLTAEEQKAAKTAAFDLQMNPAHPGLQFHRLEKAKDKRFWSARVNSDIRLVIHQDGDSLLLCYVGHHDDAYRWGERRKLEVHPTTGAAQMVEIRERVEEIVVPVYVEAAAIKPPLLAGVSEADLLGYGVPPEWLADVLHADETALLTLADHLPAEAAEAVLELATGGRPTRPEPVKPGTDPFAHPDAQRRFRVMADVEELERALEFPWDRWTIFLHPAQRAWVERDYAGPARVSGSAGTGKTVVALHRAVHLAKRNPDARVLLTTFSPSLAYLLEERTFRLVKNQPTLAERIDVRDLDETGHRLYEASFGRAEIASDERVQALLVEVAREGTGPKVSAAFLWSEWRDIVDAWQIDSWEAYRDVRRLGRKTRLTEAGRAGLWKVFSKVKEALNAEGLITTDAMFYRLAENVAARKHPPYDFVVVDEAQDVSVAQLRFLAAMGGQRPTALFFAGDLGQRIFQTPFSWKSVGVDVRGRSRTLTINYRTSHQIRNQADRLLDSEVADVDGLAERRDGTISVFNGPRPVVRIASSEEAEIESVAEWLNGLVDEGVQPAEVGIFVRSTRELPRAAAAAERAGLRFRVLDAGRAASADRAAVCTMHLAKGLEFRAVAVMACDDDVIPSQERIEQVSDPSDLQEVYDTERHLLYVACTRARDFLMVSATGSTSEFLDDFKTPKSL